MSDAKPKVWVMQPFPSDALKELDDHFDVDYEPAVRDWTSAEISERLSTKGYDGVVVSANDWIDDAAVANAPNLKIMCNVGVGVNHIDSKALAKRGIVVTNTPNTLTETTADLGFALMMAAARRLPEAERYVRSGKWGGWAYDGLLGVDIHGSTLAILGMGRIGQAVARRGKGFGMKIIYHNRSQLSTEIENALGATYVTKDELFSQADHVVLVLPYSPEARHIVDAAAIARMKPTATITNIARGGLIDEDALADALANKRIAAAGLDVFEGEPAVNPKLLALDNVALAPHIGSATGATRTNMIQQCVDNVVAGLTKGFEAISEECVVVRFFDKGE